MEQSCGLVLRLAQIFRNGTKTHPTHVKYDQNTHDWLDFKNWRGGQVKVSNFGAELRSFLAAIFTVGTMSGFNQLAHAVFFCNC